jgi:hypothetical protein
MATEKQLAIQILDALERVVVENRTLKAILETYDDQHRIPWREHLATAMADRDATDATRQQFSELRSQVQSDLDLATVIQDFLKVFPPNKDLN